MRLPIRLASYSYGIPGQDKRRGTGLSAIRQHRKQKACSKRGTYGCTLIRDSRGDAPCGSRNRHSASSCWRISTAARDIPCATLESEFDTVRVSLDRYQAPDILL